MYKIPADADHFAFICNHTPKEIQTLVDEDKKGFFWPRVLRNLINYNCDLQDNYNLDECKKKFDLGCKLIEILTDKVSVPRDYFSSFIKEALFGTQTIKLSLKFEKLFELATIAKTNGKFEICELLLIEIWKEIEELETNIVRLDLDPAYKNLLNDVRRKYFDLEQDSVSLTPVDEEGRAYKKRHSNAKDRDELSRLNKETVENDQLGWLNEVEKNSALFEVPDENINVPTFGREISERERDPIHNAAVGNQASLIEDLHFIFPEALEEKDADGMTPFMLACANHSFDAASKLLELGANPYEKDNHGRSALIHLMKAIKELNEEESAKQDDLFKKLIDSNDQIFAYDVDRRSALHWAIISGKEDYAMKLVNLIQADQVENFENILILSCENNLIGLVEMLLTKYKDFGININKLSVILLKFAYDNKSSYVIYSLMNAGVNLRYKIGEIFLQDSNKTIEDVFNEIINGYGDRSATTPLMIACDNNNLDVALQLIRLGANVELIDINGHNALFHFLKNPLEVLKQDENPKRDTLFKRLIFVQDLFKVDQEGKTVLDWAVSTKKERYAWELIKLVDARSPMTVFKRALRFSYDINLIYLVKDILFRKGLIGIYQETELEILKESCDNKDGTIFKKFIKSNMDLRPFFYNICEKNDFKSLKFLIKNNFYPSDLYIHDKPLIHWVLSSCQMQKEGEISKLFALANIILDRNNEVRFLRDKEGFTLLHAAVRAKHETFVKKLLELDVDAYDKNNRLGISPLSYAMIFPCAGIINALREKMNS